MTALLWRPGTLLSSSLGVAGASELEPSDLAGEAPPALADASLFKILTASFADFSAS